MRQFHGCVVFWSGSDVLFAVLWLVVCVVGFVCAGCSKFSPTGRSLTSRAACRFVPRRLLPRTPCPIRLCISPCPIRLCLPHFCALIFAVLFLVSQIHTALFSNLLCLYAQLLDYSTVPEPDCYANQSTSLTPCGLCTKPATLLDTATGQVIYRLSAQTRCCSRDQQCSTLVAFEEMAEWMLIMIHNADERIILVEMVCIVEVCLCVACVCATELCRLWTNVRCCRRGGNLLWVRTTGNRRYRKTRVAYYSGSGTRGRPVFCFCESCVSHPFFSMNRCLRVYLCRLFLPSVICFCLHTPALLLLSRCVVFRVSSLSLSVFLPLSQQTGNTHTYTFRHDADGWRCDANT